MKKCKWCEAKIEDDVATCPFCRANQEIEYDDTTQKNHVEDFLKKYPGGRTTPKWQREESKPIIMCPTCKSVNVSRFIALKEVIGGVNTPIDCPIDDGVFQTVLQYAISELVFIFSPDEKMDIFNLLFQKAKLDKCIELAYNIKRANAKIEELSNDKGLLEKELGLLLADFEYVLDKKEIDNGIQDIFEKSLLTNKD